MPPPVEPSDLPSPSRANLALYMLGRARRQLIDAKPYLLGTPAGCNFDGLIAALESRIDRIRLHGLGPIEPTLTIGIESAGGPHDLEPGEEMRLTVVSMDADAPAFVEGYPTVPE